MIDGKDKKPEPVKAYGVYDKYIGTLYQVSAEKVHEVSHTICLPIIVTIDEDRIHD